MLHKEAWVAKLLGTHLSIQVHKKVKFSRRDNSSLAVKGLSLFLRFRYPILFLKFPYGFSILTRGSCLLRVHSNNPEHSSWYSCGDSKGSRSCYFDAESYLNGYHCFVFAFEDIFQLVYYQVDPQSPE